MIAIPIFTVSHKNLFDIFYYMDLTTFHLANKNPASPSFFDCNDMHKSETSKLVDFQIERGLSFKTVLAGMHPGRILLRQIHVCQWKANSGFCFHEILMIILLLQKK